MKSCLEIHLRLRRRLARAAGFTLLELMVVVIMVGVIAVLAVPAVTRQLRSRRNNQAAHEVALVFRQARARAMGRGSAVLVRFGAGTRGLFEIREAQSVDAGRCLSLPASSCTTTVWGVGSPQNRLVSTFDPAMLDPFSNVQLRMFKPDGSDAGSTVDICFTPLGRPYRRFAYSGSFTPMTDVPYVEVQPVDTIGITRRVLVLPTGASRLAL